MRFPLLAEKGAFKGKRVHDVHLLEDHNSSSGLLALFHAKSAIFEAEKVVPLAAEQRYDSKLGVLDSALLFVIFVGASVEESILLSRVTVEITIENDLSLLMHVTN